MTRIRKIPRSSIKPWAMSNVSITNRLRREKLERLQFTRTLQPRKPLWSSVKNSDTSARESRRSRFKDYGEANSQSTTHSTCTASLPPRPRLGCSNSCSNRSKADAPPFVSSMARDTGRRAANRYSKRAFSNCSWRTPPSWHSAPHDRRTEEPGQWTSSSESQKPLADTGNIPHERKISVHQFALRWTAGCKQRP